MKRKIRCWIAAVLMAALMTGMCMTASAFTYPSAYWKLHDAWAVAVEEENAEEVLSLAQQTYDLLMQYDICTDICYNLEPKCARASWCAEMKGDLDGAIMWLNRQRTFASWLHTNVQNYSDTLINVDARMEYLQAANGVTAYALTDEMGNLYPKAAAPARGTWYGSTVDGSQSSEYAVLMYVTFGDKHSVDYWINYYQDHYPSFKKAATQGGVIELAWNFAIEGTAGAQQILNADSYIDESLEAMGNLNATVLLRVGAEMNNWSDCDPATYIQAFQKVAQKARAYDNIKMVFSPDNVSNRNVTFADFYPGDTYVDWIGVSTYHNTNYDGEVTAYSFGAPQTYGNDAYYGKGLYDSDPLVILRPLVRFAENHGKPMMISECGFSYLSHGAKQTDFAVDQMTKFYSYVNMIYPQIKAVFYFDNTVGNDHHYELAGNSTMNATYQSVIANNGAYLNRINEAGKTWKELTKVNELEGTVKLAAYTSFPGKNTTTVTWTLDDKVVSTTSQVPYYYELNTALLAPGKHTLKVTARAGQFNETATYELYVEGQGGLPLYTASDWAVDLLQRADTNQLITKRNKTDFQKKITRLEFAELAVNLIEQATGKEVVMGDTTFVDTTDEVARKAVAAGVTSGKGEGKFAPDANITRQEICVMLNKVIQYVDAANASSTLTNFDKQMDTSRFNDTDQIAGWAVEAMALLTNNGLMSGKGAGVAPLDNTTTQEAVALILALYNKF